MSSQINMSYYFSTGLVHQHSSNVTLHRVSCDLSGSLSHLAAENATRQTFKGIWQYIFILAYRQEHLK